MADELSLISPVNDNFRRDVELADPTLLDPTEATALVQGEWIVRNTAGKGARVGASSVRGAMQVFTQKGDFSAQSIGKVAVLQLHEYEAETTMFADVRPVNLPHWRYDDAGIRQHAQQPLLRPPGLVRGQGEAGCRGPGLRSRQAA